MGDRRGGGAGFADLLRREGRPVRLGSARLDGQAADEIYTDLTARRAGAGVDLTAVQRIDENLGVAFMRRREGRRLRH